MKHTLTSIANMKAKGEKIAALTAYDAGFAALLDQGGIDIVLVGDSLGMVLQGAPTTQKVTMADMIYHTQMVSRSILCSLLVSDMPFMSYATPAQAVGNAARLVREGGAEVVKLEGGEAQLEVVYALSQRGIAVCGHLGLTPQSVNKLGGYRVQGQSEAQITQIKSDALALETAGAEMLVLECVPQKLAAEITQALKIPVIGIGAGRYCDGQVLVLYDMLGITPQKKKFSPQFLSVADSIPDAIKSYVRAVKDGTFPTSEHSF